MNILFVSSRNKWRSPTAEWLFKNHPTYNVRSAGTSSSARIRINEKLLDWADNVFVMEKKHREQIRKKFPSIYSSLQIITLDIPDDYQFMDEELIEVIKLSIKPSLDNLDW